MAEWLAMSSGVSTNPGEQLLKPLMVSGKPATQFKLAESRKRLQKQLQLLPDHLRVLEPARSPYPVSFSERLEVDLDKIRRKLGFGDT